MIKTTYGCWAVYTDTDSTRCYLGSHTGHIDEIALALADKACYSLIFTQTKPLDLTTPTSGGVSVVIEDYDGLDPSVFQDIKKLFDNNNRPVRISQSSYYKSFVITAGRTASEYDHITNKIKRAKVLAKLSDEEKEILGIHN